jgi:predicted NAD/FAD-binding protein
LTKSVAIIGGGIAGLTAGYLLHKKYDVSMFEKSNRIGGNAYCHETAKGERMDIAVAAFGRAGYANFYSLLGDLDIETAMCPNSYMSFHDLDTKSGIYLTPTISGARSQGFSFVKPSTLLSIVRLFGGLRSAHDMFELGELAGLNMEQCIAKIKALKGDTRTILLSVLCLLSSMSCEEVLATPAEFFIGKLKTHHDVISPKAVYSVCSVLNGTKSYVDALSSGYKKNIRLTSKIKSVLRNESGVVIIHSDGRKDHFDRVIFACHTDEILKMLDKPTSDEKRLLGAWAYKNGRVVVHRDHTFFPARNLIQAYTFLYRAKKGSMIDTSVNGALWHEPCLSDHCDYISTQHPNFPIRDKLIELDTTLRTPMFSFNACATIKELPTLNGVNHSYFCGSYFGYGLHDDAITSAINVAKNLGVSYTPRARVPRLITGIIDKFRFSL